MTPEEIEALIAERDSLQQRLEESQAQVQAQANTSAVPPQKVKFAELSSAVSIFRYKRTSSVEWGSTFKAVCTAGSGDLNQAVRLVLSVAGEKALLDEVTQRAVLTHLVSQLQLSSSASASDEEKLHLVRQTTSFEQLMSALRETRCGTLSEPHEVFMQLFDSEFKTANRDLTDPSIILEKVNKLFEHLTGPPREVFFSESSSVLRDSLKIAAAVSLFPSSLRDDVRLTVDKTAHTSWDEFCSHVRKSASALSSKLKDIRAKRSSFVHQHSGDKRASGPSGSQPSAKLPRSYDRARSGAGASTSGASARPAGLPSSATVWVSRDTNPVPDVKSHPSSEGWHHFIVGLTDLKIKAVWQVFYLPQT